MIAGSTALHRLLLNVSCAMSLAALVPAQIVYVDHAAAGANNGTSWTNAYNDPQAALAATAAGQIWVAAGTYYAGAPGNQLATFQLANGVAIYGGFAGTETQLGQRDVEANQTTLSGDIDQNDTYGVGTQWWRFGWNFNTGNSFNIVTGSGTDSTAILDGFTLFAGLGDGPASPTYHGGGGLFVYRGDPTIRNCTFQFNALGYGSAALLYDCNSTFEGCTIRDGYTINTGRGGVTSGIYAHGSSTLTFTDCDFINHYYVASFGRGYGAAVHLGSACRGTFSGCDFVGNQTGNFFAMGEPDGAYGAGIYNRGHHLIVDRCTFVDNFAHGGAGIYTWSGITLTNSLFARNRVVEYPITSVAIRGGYGAGFATRASSGKTTTVVNCTFVENHGDKGAGLAAYSGDAATIRNTLIYHNFADSPPPGEDPIWILKQQIVGNYDLARSCVEGLLETEPGEDPPEAANFPACFDMDPRLVSLAANDYHLAADAPCIGAGDDAAVPSGLLIDLEGNPRMIGPVDIGSYEFGGVASPSLVCTNLVQQRSATYTVRNALPSEPVFYLYSFVGTGAGPCLPPPSTFCLGLLPPIGTLVALRADPSGTAPLTFTVPPGTPLVGLHIQAVMLRTAGPEFFVATNALSRTINAAP